MWGFAKVVRAPTATRASCNYLQNDRGILIVHPTSIGSVANDVTTGPGRDTGFS